MIYTTDYPSSFILYQKRSIFWIFFFLVTVNYLFIKTGIAMVKNNNFNSTKYKFIYKQRLKSFNTFFTVPRYKKTLYEQHMPYDVDL